MPFNSQDMTKQFAELIVKSEGEHGQVEAITGYQQATANSLVFIQNAEQANHWQGIQPAVVVCQEDVAEQLPSNAGKLIVSVNKIGLAHALIKQHYDDYQAIDNEWPDIHPSAVIHKSATIGKGCHVGPNAVIGAECVIGDYCVIRANAVIEHHVSMGAHCIINSLVNLGYDCQLGQHVTIHAGTIIGNEGFGFASDKQQHHRIPHTGKVIIGNHVQIGSNCNIDRGTYGATQIADGVKIDALCHIAHNVSIGNNTLLVAQTGIAGSSTIGKNVIISGQSAISDHKTVADNAILVHRCGVTENITEAGTWAGTPAKPFKQYVQGLNLAKKVKQLSLRLKKLEQSASNK